jgi:hypothetical protein
MLIKATFRTPIQTAPRLIFAMPEETLREMWTADNEQMRSDIDTENPVRSERGQQDPG